MRFWRVVHHCVAHPLLAVTDAGWAHRFHDWTGEKMGPSIDVGWAKKGRK